MDRQRRQSAGLRGESEVMTRTHSTEISRSFPPTDYTGLSFARDHYLNDARPRHIIPAAANGRASRETGQTFFICIINKARFNRARESAAGTMASTILIPPSVSRDTFFFPPGQSRKLPLLLR